MSRILLSAYACEPEKGSEPGVGWAWVKELSAHHNLWVITRSNNRSIIESREDELSGEIHFVYVDLPPVLRFWKRGNFGINLYYHLWQIAAWIRCRRLVAEESIELAHHVTLMTVTRFSFVTLLGIPSVIGPVGGLQQCPVGARKFVRHSFREALRNLSIASLWLNPLFRFSVGRVTRLILATGSGQKNLPASIARNAPVVLQIGADFPPECEEAVRPSWLTGEYVVLWSGRLEDHKGLEILIRAVGQLKTTGSAAIKDLQVIVTGKGPEKSFYLSLIESLGIQEHFHFAGWLDRDMYEQLWQEADVFAFTSLRETTGVALQEAMLRGKACVVVANGGPAEMITSESGILIDGEHPDDFVDGFSDAVELLYAQPELRRILGEKAETRARQLYAWKSVAAQMESIYKDAIADYSQK